MLQEEDDVDIYGVDPDVRTDLNVSQTNTHADSDEDFAWADEEPDGDVGDWKMDLVMQDDNELG